MIPHQKPQMPIDILVIVHALSVARLSPQFYLGVSSSVKSLKCDYSQIIIFYIKLLYSVSLC